MGWLVYWYSSFSWIQNSLVEGQPWFFIVMKFAWINGLLLSSNISLCLWVAIIMYFFVCLDCWARSHCLVPKCHVIPHHPQAASSVKCLGESLHFLMKTGHPGLFSRWCGHITWISKMSGRRQVQLIPAVPLWLVFQGAARFLFKFPSFSQG